MPAATTPSPGFALEMSVVTWIGTGLWVFAGGIVIRGFTAKTRVHRDLTDLRSQALAVLFSDHLMSVLHEIAKFVLDFERPALGVFRAPNPERIPAALHRAELGAQRQRIAEIGADASALDTLQDEMVTHSQRQGWAAAAFLFPWSYLLFWGSQKGVDLPVVLTVAAFGAACLCVGFGTAEAFAGRRTSNRFVELHRSYTAGLR